MPFDPLDLYENNPDILSIRNTILDGTFNWNKWDNIPGGITPKQVAHNWIYNLAMPNEDWSLIEFLLNFLEIPQCSNLKERLAIYQLTGTFYD